jgi:hypothetical protein
VAPAWAVDDSVTGLTAPRLHPGAPPSYGKNIHPDSVTKLQGLGVLSLRLDWIDNHEPFLCGSLTQAGVRTDKVLGQATVRQI